MSLFKKLKLVNEYTVELNCSPENFIDHFTASVDYSKLGLMSDSTDVFSSSKNKLKGYHINNSFYLRHKRTMFSGLLNIPKITGQVKPEQRKTVVAIKITAITPLIILLFTLVCLVIGINLFLAATGKFAIDQGIILPAILAPLFIFTILFFGLRISVHLLKKRIQQTLFDTIN